MTLVTQSDAARAGLKRAWTTQVGSPRATGEIAYLHLDGNLLLALTEMGTLAAMDAETGQTLWSTQVGPRGRTCTEPAANNRYVVVINGSTLYVFDRASGELLWQKPVEGTPGAGPALTETHVFIPMVNGKMEAYRLDKGSRQRPWNYKSAGRVLIPPVVTENGLAWTTERGHMYVVDTNPDDLRIRYRLETRGTVQARPAFWTPNLFATSSDGNLYAVQERAGKIAWKFMMGEPSYESPVAINGRVYAITDMGHMYCLDSKTGKEIWHTSGMSRFIASSDSRIYVNDRSNRMAVLDAKTGVRYGSLSLAGISHRLFNTQTDRIYLATPSGAVQCLHEPALAKPLAFKPPKEKRPTLRSANDEATEEEASTDASTDESTVEEGSRPTSPPTTSDDDPFR